MDSHRVPRREFIGGALAVSALGATVLSGRAPATAALTATNVQVSHDRYPSHSEPCLAVNPSNPRNLLAACETPQSIATYVSFDGGMSWHSNRQLPLPAGSPGGGNVSAAFDASGRGFICGLLETASGQRSTYVWLTDDNGRTFTPPAGLGSGPGLDRPWLATDTSGSQTVHVVWANGATLGVATTLDYARSTDGGRTFDAPRRIARVTSGLGNPVVVCGASGTVYVLYGSGAGALETGTDIPMAINVICSRDGGQTFEQPIEVGRGQDLITFPTLRLGTAGTSRPARNSSLPAITADPHSGLACIGYTVHHAGSGHADVMLTTSRDGGRHWTPPTAVTPRDEVIYFEPQVAIDGTGRIGVMAFAMTRGLVDVVMMLTDPNSVRFSAPITVTDQPFNPAKVADPNGRLQLGDYQALATTPSAFHPLWNDARTGKLQLFTATVPSSAIG